MKKAESTDYSLDNTPLKTSQSYAPTITADCCWCKNGSYDEIDFIEEKLTEEAKVKARTLGLHFRNRYDMPLCSNCKYNAYDLENVLQFIYEDNDFESREAGKNEKLDICEEDGKKSESDMQLVPTNQEHTDERNIGKQQDTEYQTGCENIDQEVNSMDNADLSSSVASLLSNQQESMKSDSTQNDAYSIDENILFEKNVCVSDSNHNTVDNDIEMYKKTETPDESQDLEKHSVLSSEESNNLTLIVNRSPEINSTNGETKSDLSLSTIKEKSASPASQEGLLNELSEYHPEIIENRNRETNSNSSANFDKFEATTFFDKSKPLITTIKCVKSPHNDKNQSKELDNSPRCDSAPIEHKTSVFNYSSFNPCQYSASLFDNTSKHSKDQNHDEVEENALCEKDNFNEQNNDSCSKNSISNDNSTFNEYKDSDTKNLSCKADNEDDLKSYAIEKSLFPPYLFKKIITEHTTNFRINRYVLNDENKPVMVGVENIEPAPSLLLSASPSTISQHSKESYKTRESISTRDQIDEMKHIMQIAEERVLLQPLYSNRARNISNHITRYVVSEKEKIRMMKDVVSINDMKFNIIYDKVYKKGNNNMYQKNWFRLKDSTLTCYNGKSYEVSSESIPNEQEGDIVHPENQGRYLTRKYVIELKKCMLLISLSETMTSSFFNRMNCRSRREMNYIDLTGRNIRQVCRLGNEYKIITKDSDGKEHSHVVPFLEFAVQHNENLYILKFEEPTAFLKWILAIELRQGKAVWPIP